MPSGAVKLTASWEIPVERMISHLKRPKNKKEKKVMCGQPDATVSMAGQTDVDYGSVEL